VAIGGPVTFVSAKTPAVTLTGQTATVLATASDQSPFSIDLQANPGAPGSLSVSTQLYARLTTRSGLVAALSSSGPSNQIAQTNALAFSCLPSSPKGGVQLRIDVVTSSATTPTLAGGCTGSTKPPTYNLRCTTRTGSCNGVYPVAVSVTSDTGIVTKFVTLMTYIERPAAQPLRVAMALRLDTTSTATQVSDLGRALKAYPQIASDSFITATAQQQLATTASGKDALSQFAAGITANPTLHETPRVPYVGIDPGALLASGLQGDITAQVKRSEEISASHSLPTGVLDAGWFASAPVTSTTTTALAGAGFSHLILPDSSLAQPVTPSLNWGQPFKLSPGNSNVTALAIDSILSSQMVAGNQPVLAAQRLLGDMAFLYFERPSLIAPQGVVAVTPSNWAPTPAFLSALFDGLSANPVVTSSTLSSLFSQLKVGGNGAPQTRALASSAPSAPWPSSQISSYQGEQQRQGAFASAVQNGASTLSSLSDTLFDVENSALSDTSRGSSLTTAASALNDQLAKIQISGGDITLTSLDGTIPITLTSSAPYSVSGTLQVTSTQLSFPDGATFQEVLDRSTKSVRVVVHAKTAGALPLTTSLMTPQGNLSLASQTITVRVTQSSIVGVLLSVGAILVLAAWWVRTWLKKRSRPRGAR